MRWNMQHRSVRAAMSQSVRAIACLCLAAAIAAPARSAEAPPAAAPTPRSAAAAPPALPRPVPVTIRNEFLELTFYPVNVSLAVRDLRCDTTWYQTPPRGMAATDTTSDERSVSFVLNGAWSVKIELNGAFVDMTIDGDADADFEPLDFPGGFARRGADQSLVLPNSSGLVIPFNLSQEAYLSAIPGRSWQTMVDQFGLTMPWIATTDGAAGAMTLQLTPWDGEFLIEATAEGYQYIVHWLASKGKFAYARKVRFGFVAEGGHVALCKMFRAYAIEQGYLVTLRDKAAENADVEKLVGAINLWYRDPVNLDVLNEMKDAGLRKVLTSPGRNLTPEIVKQVQDMGYLVVRYHELRTHLPTSEARPGSMKLDPRFVGFPEQSTVDKDGNVIPGFRDVGGHRCSVKQLEVARLFIPWEQDLWKYNARLQDTTVAVPLFECYSPHHPVTREEDGKYRYELLKFAKDYGMLSATENVVGWCVPVLHYAEAPGTFVRLYRPTQTINTILNAPIELKPDYWQITLNEQIRAPLWQLVFHDAVIVGNRWDETPNNFADVRGWEKTNLLTMLHAQMPTYTLNEELWRKQKDMIVRSYQDVCEWNEAIGYEEMTDHRYLTPDKTVQQTVYESGRSLIVNFGEEAWTSPEGVVVEGWGYQRLEK